MNSKSHKKKRGKCAKSRSQSTVSDNLIEDSNIEEFNGSELNTFGVKISTLMGRYMVAIKDLNPGDIILTELPIVVGPCTGCKLQCVGCYQPITQPTKCKECGWPLCTTKCSGLGRIYGHTEAECILLKECKSFNYLDYTNHDKLKENLYCLVPLRCLMKKKLDPNIYSKIISMEHHNNIRKNIPEVWETNQKVIVNKMIKDWKLDYTEDEIHSICGILEVNAFEIGQGGINIRGLYPTAFLMSHNCIPNTNHNDEEKDFKLTVRASTQIKINQPITLSYAYTLQSTLKRREHLLENKFFKCLCDRCKDPTECGTYTGALLCPKCSSGFVLSTNPLDPEADWTCNNKNNKCPGYKISVKSLELLMNRISADIDSIDNNDIKSMENLLGKYRNVLHPSHYLNLEIKLNLSQLYGKISGYLIHELSDEYLNRKMEICKEIIKIFNVIEPGFTRLRGVTLYELHAPLFILTTRLFEKQQINKSQLRYRIKEVIKYLQEASIILSYESENTSEGMMGVAAKDALERMKEWGKVVGRI